MTDEEADMILEQMKSMKSDQLRHVDREFDSFITTIGESLSAYADAHKAELTMLGKTVIIAVTDDIVKKRQGEPIGALSVIGNKEDAAALYRALGQRLREQGVLEDDEV